MMQNFYTFKPEISIFILEGVIYVRALSNDFLHTISFHDFDVLNY